jgi:iron complex outermembrane receptor protein
MRFPGGDLRLAVGAEYQHQTSDALDVNNTPGDLTGAATKAASRDVESVFGEVLAPLIGPNNRLPLVEAFRLDGSVRFDNYSDFGSTTNPKIGFTWEVGSGFSLRGNFGTSFNAPSLADTTGAVDTRVQVIPISPYRAPNSPFTDLFRPTIVLAGGNPDLKPQTADTWSIGGDWEPKYIDGLNAGISYYNIKLNNNIAVAPPGFPGSLFTVPAFEQYAIINPTLAQAEAITAGMRVTGAPSVASLYTPFSTPYVILDLRRKNLGTLYATGIDFHASYVRPFAFGSLFANVSGTYALSRESQAFAGAPKVDLLVANISALQVSGTVGATWGHVTGSATMNYSSGYDVTGLAPQTHVGSFHPVNLALAYDFKGAGWAKDLTLTLNVDNLFDEETPYVNSASPLGLANGLTIGRFFNFGIHKHF